MNHGDVLKISSRCHKDYFNDVSPMLIFSLVVGLIVSIIQAVTQIQEATLAFVPKIVCSAFIFNYIWTLILKLITQFTTNLLININTYIQ